MTLTKRERIYKSAYDWINNQIDDYFTIVGLKHRGKVPVGETQYEYAIYEPANRGDATCGRGLVGLDIFEQDFVSPEILSELSELFPISDVDEFNNYYDICTNINKKIKLDDEDWDDYENNLHNSVLTLFRQNGFKIISLP